MPKSSPRHAAESDAADTAPAAPKSSPREAAVEALMRLAAEQPWNDIEVGDIAREAGLSLAEFRDLFLGDSAQRLQMAAGAGRSQECNVETDQQVLIPEKYVSNVSERLQLYAKLDRAQKPEELRKLLASMVDRFGPLPPEVEQLADIVRLRWQACKVGFTKITLKRDTLKGYLAADDEHKAYFQGEQFGTILNYVQTHPRTAKLKEHKGQLIVTFDEVRSIQQAKRVLSELGSEEAVMA